MTILRISPRGLEFHITEKGNQCEVRLIGTDKVITVDMKLEVISAAWYQWQMNRKHIQEAFQHLKPSHREFLLTGITPEEWLKIFPPEDGGTESTSDREYQEYVKNFPLSDPRD